MPTGHTMSAVYEIRVQGRLEPRWAAWFDGFTLACEAEGTTVITGTVVDQAALHGLLQSLRDLGLPLLSVTQPQDDPDQAHASRCPAVDAADPAHTPSQQEAHQ